jgi:Fic family protein
VNCPSSYLDVIPQQWAELLEAFEKLVPKDTYLHWDDLAQRPQPDGISREAWWAALKLARSSRLRPAPLKDPFGGNFRFCMPESLAELLHRVDHGMIEAMVGPDMADRSMARALWEESIASAALAGVAVPYDDAREMLRTGREPKDGRERAIVGLCRALESVGERSGEPLSPKGIVALNRCIAEGSADAPGGVCGNDQDPPLGGQTPAGERKSLSADAREQCLESICEFANEPAPNFFVHPLVRAVILHFWVLHERPFPNGNGRTARALFKWAMLHQGYPLFAFVAISPVLLRAPDRYDRAIQQVETDENDLTYFLLHQAGVICEAVEVLSERMERQTGELRGAVAKFRGLVALNPRQQAVMVHALRTREASYLIAGHQRSHGVTHQTARDDLFDLARRELLVVGKAGRRYFFMVPGDLDRRLQAAGGRRRAPAASLNDELPTNLR